MSDANDIPSDKSDALKKYKEVQFKNLQSFEELDPSFKDDLMTQIEEALPAHQSALMQRLLQNKQPLPYPPPLSFSQPWYDLIDESLPIPILLGGYRPNEEIDGVLFDEGIIINQTLWKISNSSDAAKKLMKILNQHMNQDSNEIYGLLLFDDWGILHKIENEDLISIYEEQPFFIVENQFWGNFQVQCLKVSFDEIKKIKDKESSLFFLSQQEFTINIVNQQYYVWSIQKLIS